MTTDKILISEQQITTRIKELATDINSYYCDRKDLITIGILNGSIVFMADLIRHITVPMKLDCISASSYGSQTHSTDLIYHPHLKLNVKNSDVLLVDDIFDTGQTITKLIDFLTQMDARTIEVCVLLRKNVKRNTVYQPKFVGFDIENNFVWGYGLDIGEQYRNLPHIVYRDE